jgi:hypothetical protein
MRLRPDVGADMTISQLILLSGGAEMISKIAFVACCVAAGFILAVAFHSVSKTVVAADVPAVTDVK